MRKYDKVPATSGQVGEIAGALVGEMNFSKTEANAIIGKMGAFRRSVRGFYSQYRNREVVKFEKDLARLVGVYGKLFGSKQEPNLSAINIPDKPNVGSTRLIVVAQELIEWSGNHGPLQGVQEALKEHFPCWQYTSDLDQAITRNDRDLQNGSYAVWVRDTREADEDLIDLSADDLVEKKILGITILERQLLEADWFFEKKEHMDQQNATLGSGSRSRDDGVPGARWDSGRFRVLWSCVSGRGSYLRSRRVWV